MNRYPEAAADFLDRFQSWIVLMAGFEELKNLRRDVARCGGFLLGPAAVIPKLAKALAEHD